MLRVFVADTLVIWVRVVYVRLVSFPVVKVLAFVNTEHLVLQPDLRSEIHEVSVVRDVTGAYHDCAVM